MTCLNLMSAPLRERTVSRSICPAALRGGVRRPRWTTCMSRVDLAVWPAAPIELYIKIQVLMTKFSCFALAAADMKHVQHVESRSASVEIISTIRVGDAGTIWTTY